MTSNQRRLLATAVCRAAEDIAKKFHVKTTVTAGPVKVTIPAEEADEESGAGGETRH